MWMYFWNWIEKLHLKILNWIITFYILINYFKNNLYECNVVNVYTLAKLFLEYYHCSIGDFSDISKVYRDISVIKYLSHKNHLWKSWRLSSGD